MSKKNIEVTLAGKTYTMSGMGHGAFEKLETHLRSQQFKAITQILKEIPECPERIEMVKEHSKPITDKDVDAYSASVKGGLYTIWLLINQNHPDFTHEEFSKISIDELTVLQDANAATKKKKPGRPVKS